MGNTVGKEDCVNLEGFEITKGFYTVKRTSGDMETGWIMGSGYGSPEWVTQNAFKRTTGGWRIYMTNGKDNINTVVQGWRPVRTIYPTKLEGDKEFIEKWQGMVIELLDQLEDTRLMALLADDIEKKTADVKELLEAGEAVKI